MSAERAPSTYRIPFYLAFVALIGVSVFALFTYRRADDLSKLRPWKLGDKRDKNYPFTVESYGFKYQGDSGNLIDEEVLVFGAFEKERLFFLRDFLANSKIDKPVVLDVGANTGHHSMFLSRHAAKVHSFEPFPPVIRKFKHNLSLNPEIKNVVLHEVGLGDKDAELPFVEPPPDNHGVGSFRPTADQKAGGKLRIVPGDDWLRDKETGPVAVVKIDVEGFEEAVLTGLKKTLETHRPLAVVEVSPVSTNGTIDSLEKLRGLLPESYEFLLLPPRNNEGALKGAYTTQPLKAEDFRSGRQLEVVAYPKERSAQVPR